MLSDPRVSACMVLYHSDKSVENTARCIAESTVPVSLYVVDNSPEDVTAQFVQLECPDAVILPQKKNIGYGRANNAVIPLLRSRYHLILNPDITFAPDLIERMIQYMDQHEDVVILTPRVLNPDGTEQFLPRRRPTVRYLLGGPLEKHGDPFAAWRREFTLADEDISEPVEVEFATGCFLLIRTHAFYRMQGFDPRFFLYHEDTDLSLKALRMGKIVYHPQMCVTHAWNRGSAHSKKLLMMHISSTIKYFAKWGLKW
ncbi:MAG: glycosyltransferase family 2 protein [Clostridia bacterium]|nr:glycosyltransferase family 2 protein [Clostridia bacterium]